MAEKLKSAFQNLYLQLKEAAQKHRNQLFWFLKSILFGLALSLVTLADFSVASIFFFTLFSSWLYSRPLFESIYVWYGFLVLVPVAILGMKILIGTIFYWPGLALFFGIFYLLLGIKNYLLVKRSRLYFVAATLLFYSLFIIFFLADKSEWFLAKYSLAILATFLLFREWLALIPAFSFPRRELLASVVGTLIVAQLLWVVALLPIGFISSANLMLLFVFVIADFLLKHFTGGLSKEFLIQHLFFFLLLGAIIFWTSSWSIGNL